MTDPQEPLHAHEVGVFLAQHPDAGIRVAVNDGLVPIEDLYFLKHQNDYVIELDSEELIKAIGVPELWVCGDVMKFMGVSRQRVNQLVREYPKQLAPVARLPGRQGLYIWLASTWRRFAEIDRPPGVQRKPGR